MVPKALRLAMINHMMMKEEGPGRGRPQLVNGIGILVPQRSLLEVSGPAHWALCQALASSNAFIYVLRAAQACRYLQT
jgi:hypothetical protein